MATQDLDRIDAAAAQVPVGEGAPIAGAGEPERRIPGARFLRFLPAVLLVLFIVYLGQSQASSRKWIDLGTEAMYLGAAALGVNILLGYTGLLSLGHAAFFIAGGYAGAIFATNVLHLPAWAGFAPAFVFGALMGALLALMCCHLRGFYLTVVTLAFGSLMPALVVVFRDQLGGANGRPVSKFFDTTKFPTGGRWLNAGDNQLYVGLYYVSALLLLVTLFLCWNLVRSRWGRAYMAIRESEIAAKTSGVNSYWYKVSSFALSAGIVAMAGWVGAERFVYVSPMVQAGQAQTESFRYVIMIVVGGMGTLVGPIWGAFGFVFGFGIAWVQNNFRDYNGLLFGALGLFGVATAPEGAMGNLRKNIRRYQLWRARQGRPMRRRAAPDIDAELTRPVPRSTQTGGTVLEVNGLTKRFGGLAALNDVDLAVKKGTIHALIGPNGSGKTTFINVITGLYDASAGRIQFAGDIVNDASAAHRSRMGMARTFQNLQLWRRMSVVENVMVGMHGRTKTDLVRSLLGTPGSRREERRTRQRAWGLLHFVGLSDKGHELAGALAFADLRRLEIARALASDPELMMLDEPGAGMHPSEIRDLVALIRKVRDAGVTVLLVEHHMDIVMGLSDTVSVLDYGQKIAEGTPEQVRQDPRVIEAYLGAETAA